MKISFSVITQIFDLQLLKRNTEQSKQISFIKTEIAKHVKEIKEITNFFLAEMTGLRNLSKQEKTSYIVNIK